MTRLHGFILALIFGIAITARGDVGVFTGNGQNLRQISSKTVQLVSIDVTITPGRGPFLFDGTLPGLDGVQYDCTFQLRNLSDKPAQIQVGFPIDGQEANEPANGMDKAKESLDWVMRYGFIARDEKTTYNIDFVHQDPTAKEGVNRATFSWKMTFAAKETRTLHVAYRIPMNMTLASTLKPGVPQFRPGNGMWQLMPLEFGYMEYIGYITETGSSWAGKVEKAKFRVVTGPFEKYLNHRGFFEESTDDMTAADAAKMKQIAPVQQAWWYRKEEPAGSKIIKADEKTGQPECLEWSYANYKPKDPIEVTYFVTQFPRKAEDVSAFVDAVTRGMSEAEKHDPKKVLASVRDILLATYGQEPKDAGALAFVKDQQWYAPRKDFTIKDLTAAQQAVLAAYDQKAALVK